LPFSHKIIEVPVKITIYNYLKILLIDSGSLFASSVARLERNNRCAFRDRYNIKATFEKFCMNLVYEYSI
jgi:hypothetical protein